MDPAQREALLKTLYRASLRKPYWIDKRTALSHKLYAKTPLEGSDQKDLKYYGSDDFCKIADAYEIFFHFMEDLIKYVKEDKEKSTQVVERLIHRLETLEHDSKILFFPETGIEPDLKTNLVIREQFLSYMNSMSETYNIPLKTPEPMPDDFMRPAIQTSHSLSFSDMTTISSSVSGNTLASEKDDLDDDEDKKSTRDDDPSKSF